MTITYIDTGPIKVTHGAVPGMATTKTYVVTTPRWVRRVRRIAEAIIHWTRRFDRYTEVKPW